MSCSSCGCQQCQCEHECDPAEESLASQLANFQTAFFGSITKTCVNGEVVWSLPCDLDGGIPGFPRLPNEGIACYLLRIWQTECNCSFLTLTDTPDSYAGMAGRVVAVNGAQTGLEFVIPASAGARGFPSAQAVWLDTDAALQTPSGQPAFTTAQAAYNAADALATLSGLPVVIAVGKGSGVEFGSIATGGADWNSDVSIFGLGRNISSINAISTAAVGANSGDMDIKINGCSIDSALATLNMDATGTFDAGDVFIDGDDAIIPVIYTATPNGGGDGGDVTVADVCGILFGPILTNASAAGSTSGSVDFGDSVQGLYISTSVSGAAGNGGNVTLGHGVRLYGSIDTFCDIGSGGDVVIGQEAFVEGSITTTSSDGQAGDITTGVGSTCPILTANSSDANGSNITVGGYAVGVVGDTLSGNFNGATVTIQSTGHVGAISVQSTGTGGQVVVNGNGVVDSNVNNSSSAGSAGPISIDAFAKVGSITSNSVGANGPTINMFGVCTGNIIADTTGAFTGANVAIGNGVSVANSSNISVQAPTGTGGSVGIRDSSRSGNINTSGETGGNVLLEVSTAALSITTEGSAGNGGLVDVGAGSQVGEISTESIGGFNGGNVALGFNSSSSGNVSTVSDSGTSGTVTLAMGASVGGNIDVSATTGIAGLVVSLGGNNALNIIGTATTGTASTVSIEAGSNILSVDITHAGGTGGGINGANASFGSITAQASGSASGATIDLENCVVSGIIDGQATTTGIAPNISIRSGSYGAINVNCTAGGTSLQVNVFAASIGAISGNNDGGTQATFLTCASCSIGDVSLRGTTGADGGFINADNTKFGTVDTRGDIVSGQINMKSCSFQSLLNSGSAFQALSNCSCGTVLTAGFLSRFYNCHFESNVACVTLTSDGAYFNDCSFSSSVACIDAAVPTTCNMYGGLSRTAQTANVTFSVSNDFFVDPVL